MLKSCAKPGIQDLVPAPTVFTMTATELLGRQSYYWSLEGVPAKRNGLEWCELLVDYYDVFISCLDSHSDGTHSLQSIHWWASDDHF